MSGRGRRTPRPARGVIAIALAALLGGCGDSTASPAPDAAGRITVAAASHLRPAFDELGARFTGDTGIDVTFSYGSSGQLREQTVNGAPFDVFAAADEDFVDAVVDAGRGDPRTKAEYGRGRLVLVAPPGQPAPGDVEELAHPAFARIAVANPEHAPYGRAALEALDAAGVAGAVEDRLVYGENIADTLRLVESGNADVGIVALSLVVGDGRAWALVPEQLHGPLRQSLVVTATGERADSARAFAAYTKSPEGRAVLLRHGLALGEALPRDG